MMYLQQLSSLCKFTCRKMNQSVNEGEMLKNLMYDQGRVWQQWNVIYVLSSVVWCSSCYFCHGLNVCVVFWKQGQLHWPVLSNHRRQEGWFDMWSDEADSKHLCDWQVKKHVDIEVKLGFNLAEMWEVSGYQITRARPKSEFVVCSKL